MTKSETSMPESLENLPIGADGLQYQWLDLDGEGFRRPHRAGRRLVSTSATAVRFSNKGNGRESRGAVRTVDRSCDTTFHCGTSGARHQFLDLAGDGNLDLVRFEKPVSGFFERTEERAMGEFHPVPIAPNVDWDDPNLKFIDLTGDGHADILVTEDDALTWYPSLAEEGFGSADTHAQAEGRGERPGRCFRRRHPVHLSWPTCPATALRDIVRIRNGEVCYWPNLGYGRFGAKVTMDDAPWFDSAGPIRPEPYPACRHRRFRNDGHHLSRASPCRHLPERMRQRLESGRVPDEFSGCG